MSVLGSQLWITDSNGTLDGIWLEQDEDISFGMRYVAAYYWAVLMTTGLNVPIGPGLQQRQVVYECFICFLGVCMQAYMLGAAASEIANIDAHDSIKRQKFDSIKNYLRGKRVPYFLREPILEYYERVLTQMDADNDHLMAELPSSLKIQLALTLNADFLKGVSFFRNLEPRIIATLVLCLRSRIYMVSPRELAESHVCTVQA